MTGSPSDRIERFMGPISSSLQPEADGQWVRYSDHLARVEELEATPACPECAGSGVQIGSDVEPECCGNTTSSGECRGECAVPREVEVEQPCEACGGSGKRQPPNVLTVDEAFAVVAASFGEEHNYAVLDATIKRLGDWVDSEAGAVDPQPEGGQR